MLQAVVLIIAITAEFWQPHKKQGPPALLTPSN